MAFDSPTDRPTAVSVPLTYADLKSLPLSQRVIQLREQRDITQKRLAEITALPLSFIEDVEGGIERVISATQRLRLARALRVPGDWLLMNTPVSVTEIAQPRVNRRGELLAYGKRLPLRAMMAQPDGFWPCPQCGAGLTTRTFERRDLDETPVTLADVQCSQCLFRANHEWIGL